MSLGLEAIERLPQKDGIYSICKLGALQSPALFPACPHWRLPETQGNLGHTERVTITSSFPLQIS